MTALLAWGATTLVAATVLMLLVVAVRAPVRRWFGARAAYALWVLPAVRMMLPPLPAISAPPVAGGLSAILVAGPQVAASLATGPDLVSLAAPLAAIWLAGAVSVFATYAVRHIAFCRRLRATGSAFGHVGAIAVIVGDVDAPLAFGVVHRVIAVPRGFDRDYAAGERDLALAHEAAHHARGDLLANWASLVVLAAHWWNPVAWLAIRAFRDDQEYAADAHVLGRQGPGAVALYAGTIARAAGIGALPVCNLTARSNLKGRLMMLRSPPRSRRRLAVGAAVLTLAGGAALVATAATSAAPAGKQAVTIGIKPDGSGGYAVIVGGTAVPSGAPLPGGATLPGDFDPAGGCDLKPAAKPHVMVIKGFGATRTYTVMCAGTAPAPVRATLAEGLASLTTMRTSVATQPASTAFPEAERTHALGAIDRSIAEVQATLATLG